MTLPETTNIKVTSTEDGLHLVDSILWFDSFASGQLSFLSSALLQNNSKVPQVVTTEETAKILEACHKKTNALKCQYNRPFSIGHLKMELLPSGGILGGASLYVETINGRLLYAPHLQTQRITTVRQMQLKRANTLVLGAHHPLTKLSLPIRKRQHEKLLKMIHEQISLGNTTIILCPVLAIAQELTKLLSDNKINIGVHAGIKKINKIYESHGSQLGHYSTLSSKKRNQVLLYPHPSDVNAKIPPLPNGPKIIVNDGYSENAFEGIDGYIGSIILNQTSDVPELKEVVSAVRPNELYLFGAYAKSYLKEMDHLAPSVSALYTNDQPTLF